MRDRWDQRENYDERERVLYDWNNPAPRYAVKSALMSLAVFVSAVAFFMWIVE